MGNSLDDFGGEQPAVVTTGDILVVDDNPHNLLAIEAALGDLGDRLIKARSGREALRYLLTEDCALILLDVLMPSMDGFETARLIRSRERSRHLPIIFVTAFDTDEREVLEAYKLGAVDFLFKPIIPEILRAKASVFVELQRRTAEVTRQAALLRDHERREHERRLEEERRRWEEEALRRRMEEQRKSAEELAHRAEELARTVAERERAERELTRTNHRLAEADRRKDEFMAMLAHELRNPLTPLVAGLELLRQRPLTDPVSARVRDAMDRQVVQLCRLVDDLLDVSRITAGKIELRHEWVDLRAVVKEAVHSANGNGRRVEVELPDRPLGVRGDPVRLAQIVQNLLHNACRYTGEDGRIAITAEHGDDEVVLEVADDGRGISPMILERIFDMFVQEGPGEGLGIGLTLVERLVSLHGGRIAAESPGPGGGSVFTVRLPAALVPEVAAGARNGDRTRAGPVTTPLRVLLIDDNADVCGTMCELLSLVGHRVDTASDGAEGLELLLRIRPDVALVDIGLPKLDGFGVAERARAALPDGCPRLVAMTGFGQPSDRERAARAGFHDYLVKPASFDSLMSALRGT